MPKPALVNNYCSLGGRTGFLNILMTYRWSAICHDTTFAGLEGITGSLYRAPKVLSGVARWSYGFPVSKILDPTIHDIADRFLDPSEGTYRAKGPDDSTP